VPLAVALGLALLWGGAWLPGRADAATTGPQYYLDVGGSASVGFQPTDARPHGQPTEAGYADDLVDEVRSIWPNLQLAEIGCPGATTATMLDGGGHCPYPGGTQLTTAVDFLHSHSTVLVTVDLGFNNLRICIAHGQVNQACVDQSIDLVGRQLPQILAALRAAGGPGVRIVGIGHYDPYLGAYLHGSAGRVFASASLGGVSQLDQSLQSIYARYGIPMADVAGSFETTSTEPTMVNGLGVVPRNVARICSLTWMCAAPPYGPNQHPNADGYRLISRAIETVLGGG
jgi:lysophospholipase L1-like esterase